MATPQAALAQADAVRVFGLSRRHAAIYPCLVVVGLGKADFSRGPSFVAISRAKTLGGLAFAGPVTMARLTRTIDGRNRAREAAHVADTARRARLTLMQRKSTSASFVALTMQTSTRRLCSPTCDRPCIGSLTFRAHVGLRAATGFGAEP
jgi:hypothetical protein